jgi:carbamoyl-phosphate synthase small subunit
MTNYTKLPAILLLEDGTIYHGKAAGKIGTTTGEICFSTGMTGYQEIFTDPSYFGQIMVTTNAHIGNYGINNQEGESDRIQISGLVCKNYNIAYSRKMSDQSIQSFFEEENLVGISDIDTRSLVRHIRSKGAMNAIISSEIADIEALKAKLKQVPSMKGLELSSKVSTKKAYYYGDENAQYRVSVLDLGIKKNILRNFADLDVLVKVFPVDSTFEEINAWNPDGFFVSNGPGDPAAMPKTVECVKEMLATDKPFFGICLGHQILALANGIGTEKMFNGHRGTNHPVKNLIKDSCEITSQNHGFGLIAKDVENSERVEITHRNLNDNTIEGIRVKGKNAFSVQFHPEASPGPHDSRYLFSDFIKMLGK